MFSVKSKWKVNKVVKLKKKKKKRYKSIAILKLITPGLIDFWIERFCKIKRNEIHLNKSFFKKWSEYSSIKIRYLNVVRIFKKNKDVKKLLQ